MPFDLIPLLAAAAPAAELPPEAVAAVAEAATGGGIDYLELMIKASWPVKLIVVLLLLGSLMSWVIIFRKNRVYSRAVDDADEFESRFWSGVDLTQLYRAATDRNRVVSGVFEIDKPDAVIKALEYTLNLHAEYYTPYLLVLREGKAS